MLCSLISDYMSGDCHALIVNDEIRYDILLSHSLYYNLNEEDKKDLIIWKSLSKV